MTQTFTMELDYIQTSKIKEVANLLKKNMETEQSTHCSRFLSTGEEKIKEFYFFKFLYINLINFSTVQPA